MKLKLHDKARALLQRWGPRPLKRRLWDHEFSHGRWDGIAETPGDPVYEVIVRHARGGSILDLGCGSGNTGCELPAGCCSAYLGVDVSGVALEAARRRSEACGRGSINRYVQADIATFSPGEQHDLILFRETIYYLPERRIPAVLRRYSRCLRPGGVIVIRWYEAGRAGSLLRLASPALECVEDHRLPDGGCILVLAPAA